MTIKILSSGSNANCYALCDGTATIQLECGLPLRKTLEGLNWQLPDAILITHEHADHARSVKKFLKRGVEMFMTAGTADGLNLQPGLHNLHYLHAYEIINICGHQVFTLPVDHDANEPVNFIIDGEILFVTDTGNVPHVNGKFKTVMIEANYDLSALNLSDIGEAQRVRISQNHLSIVQVKHFLRGLLEPPDEVILLHISTRHGDAKSFVRQVKLATGIENVKAAIELMPRAAAN